MRAFPFQHIVRFLFNKLHFSNREAGQLFSESYQNVAVMFASIPNYINFFSETDDKKPLNILHEIISKFDQVQVLVLISYIATVLINKGLI